MSYSVMENGYSDKHWLVLKDGSMVIGFARNPDDATRIASALEFAEHREEIVNLLDDALFRIGREPRSMEDGQNMEDVKSEIAALLSKLGGTAND